MTSSPPGGLIRFSERVQIARVSGGDEFKDVPEDAIFHCEEEPHMVDATLAPGYIPLHFGDILKDQYQIVRKLGWGGNSSVWLAKDLKATDATDVYRAIKVLTIAETRAVQHDVSHELPVLSKIALAADHPGRDICVKAVELFVVTSVHGSHMCIVSKPYSISLTEFLSCLPIPFPVSAVKGITKRLLQAVDFVHSIGYAHTDIKANNLLISLEGQEEGTAKHIKEIAAETYPPRLEPSVSPNPIITAVSQPLLPLGMTSLETIKFCLADFGSAQPIENTVTGMLIMPTLLRAPEIILQHPWSAPVDIWAVGCLIVELLTRSVIFNIDRTPDITFTDVHLARMIELVGPFPAEFLSRCNGRAEFFDDAGTLLRHDPALARDPSEASLEARMARAGVSEDEPAASSAFARRCLTIDPAARATAAELLQDEWLKV